MGFNQLKFLVRQRVLGFEVPDSPWFDSDETTAWFLERLSESERYLEFGTGGSTYSAAKLGVDFVAVDSDPYFLRSVRKKIQRDGYARSTGQTYFHADIGPTGPWGRPIGDTSPQRLEQFSRYSDPPPDCLAGSGSPDLVLVDGRFRVACALKSIRMLLGRQNWIIVVDDYSQRSDYHVIADYAELEKCVGRMAVFTPGKEVDSNQLDSAIRTYEQIIS